MFNSNDIYSHLLNGGDKQVLFDALMQEIIKAEEKVKATKEAEKKEKELADKIGKARVAAHKAMMAYFALVNPDITNDIVASILDTLESVEVRINGVAVRDGKVFFTDEEMEKIWNTLFPIHFKRK